MPRKKTLTKKEQQIRDINKLVSLFNTITEHDILISNGTKMFLGGRVLTPESRNEIIEGAKTIRNQVTWKVLINEMKHISNQRMYEKSTSIDDMIFGKAMLYFLDILEKKVNNLANMRT